MLIWVNTHLFRSNKDNADSPSQPDVPTAKELKVIKPGTSAGTKDCYIRPAL